MTRRVWIAGALAAIAAGAGGFWVGAHEEVRDKLSVSAFVQTVVARARGIADPPAPTAGTNVAPTGPIIYYRDPNGQPLYSLEPSRTEAGKAFVAVHASEDVSLEDKPPAQVASVASPSAEKRIRFYRNPMGLPDTSPTPKKDSMGMDYIPVYEGADEGSSSVTVAAGKLQRTGVRSEAAAMQAIVRPVRAPGTVQLDERRVSVVSTHSERTDRESVRSAACR